MPHERPYTILIDGYNVTKQHPRWRALSPSRARQQLTAAIQHAKWPVPVARVELVFDGDSTVTPAGRRAGPVGEVFGVPSADAMIASRVRNCLSPDRVIVVTNDREIVRSARAAGARVESAAWLLAPFGAPAPQVLATGIVWEGIIITGGLLAGLTALLLRRAESEPPRS